MSPELEHLTSLYKHVHGVVRLLKIDDTGTIPCTKEFPADEIRAYIRGYAFHKRKWFEAKHDAVAGVIYAKRVAVPSFLPPEEPGEHEEL